MSDLSPLISTQDLADRMGQPDLRVLDASWHLGGRDARPDFDFARIPDAVFFDLDASSDTNSALPHMLPEPAVFAERMGKLGLACEDRIVVYDTVGVWSAPRAWWMLRTMGAKRVQVLDGGLPKWLAETRPVETGASRAPRPACFEPAPDADATAALPDIVRALAEGVQVVDARSGGRFAGREPEPRPGLRSGHMPGALNLPFGQLIEADGTFKRGAALEAAFRDAGIDPESPVITTCGSGVTAAILSLGLAVLGRPSRLYDGSWAEWGGRADLPVVTA